MCDSNVVLQGTVSSSTGQSNCPGNIGGARSGAAPEAAAFPVRSCRERLVPLPEAGAEGEGVHLCWSRRSAIKLRSCGRRVAPGTASGVTRNRLAGSGQDPATAETGAWTLEQPDLVLVGVANGSSRDCDLI